MRRALFFTLVAFQALAAPSKKRVATLILPLDQNVQALTLKLESFSNAALEEYQDLQVLKTDELFGVAPDEEGADCFKRAESSFKQALAAQEERKPQDAEALLAAAIKEYGKAVGSMQACGNLCESLALYASLLHGRGAAEEAKAALLDLFSLSPSFELDRKRYRQSFLALKAQVATSRSARMRGSVLIRSTPDGARVALDGVPQGYAPVTLHTLPVGKHLVQLERPGFRRLGLMMEITPEDSELNEQLTATAGYRAFEGLMGRLAAEALKDEGGKAMKSVSRALKLHRAIIGILKEAGESTELTMAYFDLKRGKRIAFKQIVFQGEEFGQLRSEISRLVRHLVNAEENVESTSQSSDPLDIKHGMEEWQGEDRGGHNSRRDKKAKSGDPLDTASGTEDW